MSKSKDNDLTPKEELFCQLYVNNTGSYFGNGAHAYAAATGMNIVGKGKKKQYAVAASMATKWLIRVSVKQRINELLLEMMKDVVVDAELSKVIQQDSEFPAKVAAIKEYNRVKKRVEEPHQNTIFVLSSERAAELNEALNKNLNDKEA